MPQINRPRRAAGVLLIGALAGTLAAPPSAQAATNVSITTPLVVTQLGNETLVRGYLPHQGPDLVVGDCHAKGGSNVSITRDSNGMAYVDWNQLAFSTDTNDIWRLSLRFKDPNGQTWVTANLPPGTKMTQRNRLYLWNVNNPQFPLSASVFAQITAPGSTVEWLNSC